MGIFVLCCVSGKRKISRPPGENFVIEYVLKNTHYNPGGTIVAVVVNIELLQYMCFKVEYYSMGRGDWEIFSKFESGTGSFCSLFL
ncbi:MAG: hypothetical protein ACOCXT_06440, partial [Candidatus Dojkabacteria bacterium]